MLFLRFIRLGEDCDGKYSLKKGFVVLLKKLLLLSLGLSIVSSSIIASFDRTKIKTAFAIGAPSYLETPPIEDSLKELSPQLERWASKEFASLNQSIFYDTNFIVNSERVRERHLKYGHDKRNKGEKVSFKTSDGVMISCTYFDRNSDRLMIIGEGFTNEREKMTPFLSTISDCDIVLFDFRGQGYKPTKFITPVFFGAALASYVLFNALLKQDPAAADQSKLFNKRTGKNLALSGVTALLISALGVNPFNWSARLSQMTFGINSNLLTLGEKEELDVLAVADGFKKKKEEQTGKEYKQVYGLGICYGAFVFAKTEAMYPKTFDKLILDGCWHDLPSIIAKLKKDLRMLCVPQRGGWSKVWPLSRPWCQDVVQVLARHVWGIKFDGNITLENYLPILTDTPILYFHGKDDLMVPFNEFTEIWKKTASGKKTVILTSNEHVINHLKQKQLYKVLSELFLDLDYGVFTDVLRDIDGNMKFIKKHFDVKRHGDDSSCVFI